MPVYRNSAAFYATQMNFSRFMLQILEQIEGRANLNSIALSDPQVDHIGNQIPATFHQRMLIHHGEPKAIITLAVDPAKPHYSMFRNPGYVTIPAGCEHLGYAGASMEDAKADLNALLDKTFPQEEKKADPAPLPMLHWFIGIQEPALRDGQNPPGENDCPQQTWEGTAWDAGRVYEAYDHLVSLLAKKPETEGSEKAVDFPEARGPVFKTVSDDEM